MITAKMNVIKGEESNVEYVPEEKELFPNHTPIVDIRKSLENIKKDRLIERDEMMKDHYIRAQEAIKKNRENAFFNSKDQLAFEIIGLKARKIKTDKEETKKVESEPVKITKNSRTTTSSADILASLIIVLIAAAMHLTLTSYLGTPFVPTAVLSVTLAVLCHLITDFVYFLVAKSTKLKSTPGKNFGPFMALIRGFGTMSGLLSRNTSPPTTSTATEWGNERFPQSADL